MKRKKKRQSISKYGNILFFIVIIVAVGLAASMLWVSSQKENELVEKNNKLYSQWEIENEQKQLEAKVEEDRVRGLSVYERINETKNINILILGDTISNGKHGGLEAVSWPNKLGEWVKETYGCYAQITNNSSDNSTAYGGLYHTKIDDKISNYDMVILCFGEKDRQVFEAGQFKEIYESLIMSIREKNKKCEIITIIEGSIGEENEYTQGIREISSHYGLQVVDGISKLMELQIPSSDLVLEDGINLNEKGHEVYLNMITEVIDRNVNENRKITVNDVPQLTSAIYKDGNVITKSSKLVDGYVTNDNAVILNKKDSYVEYTVSGSIVGLVYLEQKSGQTLDVYINDQFHSTIITIADISTSNEVIIARDLQGTNTIKIVNTGDSREKIFGVIN